MEASAVKKMLFDKAQALGMERFELRQQGSDLTGMKAILWGVLDHLVNAKLREKMGGRLRVFVSGGAALSPTIAKFLLAADITVLPGYGLTETSPVLSVNTPARIKPETVGKALPGVELKQTEDGELLVKGPMVMQSYGRRTGISLSGPAKADDPYISALYVDYFNTGEDIRPWRDANALVLEANVVVPRVQLNPGDVGYVQYSMLLEVGSGKYSSG